MNMVEQREAPWSGIPWSKIVETYGDIYGRWKAGELVEPPIDCPVDDLLPAMLDALPPELQTTWMESDKLLNAGKEEDGMRLTHEVFDATGYTRVTEIRREMGASD